jgi:hypothetical protein
MRREALTGLGGRLSTSTPVLVPSVLPLESPAARLR